MKVTDPIPAGACQRRETLIDISQGPLRRTDVVATSKFHNILHTSNTSPRSKTKTPYARWQVIVGSNLKVRYVVNWHYGNQRNYICRFDGKYIHDEQQANPSSWPDLERV